jgi:hypothetical protein
MRATPVGWADSIASSHRLITTVTPYYGGFRNGPDVPITDGSITYDDTADLRRRLSITVPTRTPDGTDWDPGTATDAPLACYGQQLHVQTGIRMPYGTSVLLDQGWYLIDGWQKEDTDGTIDVTATDLRRLVADARLFTEDNPPSGSSYGTEFTRLINGILPVDLTAAPADSAINTNTVWDRDRDADLDKLCAAWGARWVVNDAGAAAVLPAYTAVTAATTPDLEVVDQSGGTIVTRQRSGERGRIYNTVVVTGNASDSLDGFTPFAVALITDPASPIRPDGPYGSVPRFYSSDLITAETQASQTAKNMLVTYSTVGRSEDVTCVPNPALELGDVVRVTTAGRSFTGRVTAITLPLTAEGGAMGLTVSTETTQDDESE